MASTVNEMIGHWIQPWPGESLLGEVIAISGDRMVCRARNGLRFEVALSDKWKVKLAFGHPPKSQDLVLS